MNTRTARTARTAAPQFDAEAWLSRAFVAGLHVQADPTGLILGFPDTTAHPAVHAYQTELTTEIRTAAGERAVWQHLREVEA